MHTCGKSVKDLPVRDGTPAASIVGGDSPSTTCDWFPPVSPRPAGVQGTFEIRA